MKLNFKDEVRLHKAVNELKESLYNNINTINCDHLKMLIKWRGQKIRPARSEFVKFYLSMRQQFSKDVDVQINLEIIKDYWMNSFSTSHQYQINKLLNDMKEISGVS